MEATRKTRQAPGDPLLPPDAEQLKLAAHINARLPAGAQVNLFRVQLPDGREEAGIIYQYGPTRATVRSPGAISIEDAPEIITAVHEWIALMRYNGRWTEDPGEAA